MKTAADKNIYNPHIGYINIGGLPCWPCVTCFGNHNCWNWFCLDASPFNSHLLQDSWENMKENENISYLCCFLDIHFCNRLILLYTIFNMTSQISGRVGLPFTFRLTWPRCSTGWRSGRSSTARSVRWGPRTWRFRRTLGIPGALGSAGGKSPLLFFYMQIMQVGHLWIGNFHPFSIAIRWISVG